MGSGNAMPVLGLATGGSDSIAAWDDPTSILIDSVVPIGQGHCIL